MSKEKYFERQVRAFLKQEGAYVIKQFGCAFTRCGTPDLLCCVRGHFLGIELKAEKGRPSKLQLLHLKHIDEAGGIPFLLYPKDFDNFKAFIKQLGSI